MPSYSPSKSVLAGQCLRLLCEVICPSFLPLSSLPQKSKLVQRVLPTRSHSSRSAAKPATAVVAPEQREMEREVQELLKAMLKQQKQVCSTSTPLCVIKRLATPLCHVMQATLVLYTPHTYTKGSEMIKYSQFVRLVLVKAH